MTANDSLPSDPLAFEPQQGNLFAMDPQGMHIVPRDFGDAPVELIGSRITEIDNLTPEQQVHLRGTLRLLGRMSRLTGLMNASDNPHARAQLEPRMEVDKVVGRSQDTYRALTEQAKEEFGKASGKYILLASGVNQDQVDRIMAERFGSFVQEYADPKNQDKRVSLVGKLDRRIKKLRDASPNDPVVSLKPRGRGRAERPDTPEKIIIDRDKVEQTSDWLTKVRLPVVDELTIGYRMSPNAGSVRAYTGAKKIGEKLGEGVESSDPEVRQVFHVAESAEHYLGFTYALAHLRGKALHEAIETLAKYEPISPTVGRYAAGAIEEFGYCMRFSANIPQTKFGKMAEHVERFGKRAFDLPEMLSMPEGRTLMRAALAEQSRRMAFMKPRYDAVVAEFGKQLPVENLDMDSIERLTIAQLLVNRARTSETTAA